MFRKFLSGITIIILTILAFQVSAGMIDAVSAQDDPEFGPSRKTDITVDTTIYDWWLANWSDNKVACVLHLEHEGLPTANEIYKSCGDEVYKVWQKTAPCVAAENGQKTQDCPGMYLHQMETHAEKKLVTIDLPSPEVWISISGCEFTEGENRCVGIPNLVLSGEEKLPNESIIRIQGEFAGKTFSCTDSECILPLSPTGKQGVKLSFWGDSSYGDSTEKYSTLVRVIPWGDFVATAEKSVDPRPIMWPCSARSGRGKIYLPVLPCGSPSLIFRDHLPGWIPPWTPAD